MDARIARLAAALALGASLSVPGVATAADPAPVHVGECVALHRSLANQLGPNGSMVEMMAGMER